MSKEQPPMVLLGPFTAKALITLLKTAHPDSEVNLGKMRGRYRPAKVAELEVSGIAERARPIILIR